MQSPSPRFRSQQFFLSEICGEMLYPLLNKPTETSVTGFCYKSVNLALEVLKNIKIILFLIHELFRQPNFSEISH